MSESLTAVTTKTVVFWDRENQFATNSKHITSPLQSPAGKCYVGFVVFMAVTINNAISWDVTLCGSCKAGRFGGTYRFHY
jgi:predicted phosphoadenosine phosphosulfate sulfurtransferase